MPVVIVAMENVLENIGEVFDNFFVDKEGQNLLVDVEEIFGSLLSFTNFEKFCLLLEGSWLTNIHVKCVILFTKPR